MTGTIRTTDSPTLRRMQEDLKQCGHPVAVAKVLAIGMELLARDLGIVKSPPILTQLEPPSEDLEWRHPVGTVRKCNGVRGYAIHSWNQHSRTFQAIGEIHTGPKALASVHAARKEMFAELREQKEAQQS
jgi:hypothetical protein